MEPQYLYIALTAFFTPLLSFVVLLFIPRRFEITISWIPALMMTLAVILTAIIYYAGYQSIIEFAWLRVGGLALCATIDLSPTSLQMLFIVYLVSWIVHVYSIGYMKEDQKKKQYFSMLGFFTFSMAGIVVSDNLLILFIFWELVGFASYILIGHWNEKKEAGTAAFKAFLFNRIGDSVFLVGLLIIYAQTRTFSVAELSALGVPPWFTIASLCIFCGVIGKSAQVPLFSWLPSAMVGPTPVSALIHAATMVAAGVYLLLRINFLFTPTALQVVTTVGIITAIIGALSAVAQFDIKKILAYSTISQLGIMVTAIGVQSNEAAFLHLITHAFFKAGLFLCIGNIIYTFHDQDIRKISGLRKQSPLTFICFLICASSLCGVPFLSGFLSKDAILTGVYGNSMWFILVLLFGVSALTCIYSVRLAWYLFFNPLSEKRELKRELPTVMNVSLIFLAAFSLWFLISWNPIHSKGGGILGLHETLNSWLITLISSLVVMVTIILSFIYYRNRDLSPSLKFLTEGFFTDTIYNAVLVRPFFLLSKFSLVIDTGFIDKAIHGLAYTNAALAHIASWIDRNVIDGIVHGISYTAKGAGSIARSIQNGKIQIALFWSLFAVIIFIFFILFT